MKPLVIIAIIAGLVLVGIGGLLGYNEIQLQKQQEKLNQCTSILSEFRIGFGATINQQNEMMLERHEQCMNEYYVEYTPNKIKQTADDFDPQFASHFSGMNCYRDDYGWVKFMGMFTNGEYPYYEIFFNTALLDSRGHVIDTGIASVSHIQPYETKIWESSFFTDRSYSECIIEIDSVIEYTDFNYSN